MHSSIKRKERVCFPSPQTSISPPLVGKYATFLHIAAKVSKKKVEKNHIDGPLGVRGRNSNNDLVREKLDWDYEQPLEDGIRKTYEWINWQILKDMYKAEPNLKEYELTASG